MEMMMMSMLLGFNGDGVNVITVVYKIKMYVNLRC